MLTPSKATTKVHIVYDGSAKMQTASSSLNNCLHHVPKESLKERNELTSVVLG